jgi:hypothetical protein
MTWGLQLRAADIQAALDHAPRNYLTTRSWASAPAVLAEMLSGTAMAAGFTIAEGAPAYTAVVCVIRYVRGELVVQARPAALVGRCGQLAREMVLVNALRNAGPLGVLRYLVDARWRWVIEVHAQCEYARALHSAGLSRREAVATAWRAMIEATCTPRLAAITDRRGAATDTAYTAIRMALGDDP